MMARAFVEIAIVEPLLLLVEVRVLPMRARLWCLVAAYKIDQHVCR
jgi:hypothetical protein